MTSLSNDFLKLHLDLCTNWSPQTARQVGSLPALTSSEDVFKEASSLCDGLYCQQPAAQPWNLLPRFLGCTERADKNLKFNENLIWWIHDVQQQPSTTTKPATTVVQQQGASTVVQQQATPSSVVQQSGQQMTRFLPFETSCQARASIFLIIVKACIRYSDSSEGSSAALVILYSSQCGRSLPILNRYL